MSAVGFTREERGAIRAQLLDAARADQEIVGAAITGSGAIETEDDWSDIDLAFAVADGVRLPDVLARWTDEVDAHFRVVHYWDLLADDRVFRVFLLSNGLEIDLAFMPAAAFGARGAKFRLVFGEARDIGVAGADTRTLLGMGWHHILHATVCIARGRPWEAEWLMSAARDYTLALACAREGLPTAYARGVDELPFSTRSAFDATLARSADLSELRRGLVALRSLFIAEVRALDPALAGRLDALLPSPDPE
ncbi:MAG TPA: nucleotidyltransferase domain-containing protein [Actinomycetota bacterium]|jgi:hypothetical protein